MRHIFRCVNCNRHTMKETCDCGNKTLPAKPVKYSAEDRFASYRRKAKIGHYRETGLI